MALRSGRRSAGGPDVHRNWSVRAAMAHRRVSRKEKNVRFCATWKKGRVIYGKMIRTSCFRHHPQPGYQAVPYHASVRCQGNSALDQPRLGWNRCQWPYKVSIPPYSASRVTEVTRVDFCQECFFVRFLSKI